MGGWTDPSAADENLEGGLQTSTALGCHGDRCESSPLSKFDRDWIDTSEWPKGNPVREPCPVRVVVASQPVSAAAG